jgi:hypothetical protein
MFSRDTRRRCWIGENAVNGSSADPKLTGCLRNVAVALSYSKKDACHFHLSQRARLLIGGPKRFERVIYSSLQPAALSSLLPL